MDIKRHDDLYSQIHNLLKDARARVINHVNSTMVITYFEIGKIIVDYEQNGNERADYGKETLKKLSKPAKPQN